MGLLGISTDLMFICRFRHFSQNSRVTSYSSVAQSFQVSESFQVSSLAQGEEQMRGQFYVRWRHMHMHNFICVNSGHLLFHTSGATNSDTYYIPLKRVRLWVSTPTARISRAVLACVHMVAHLSHGPVGNRSQPSSELQPTVWVPLSKAHTSLGNFQLRWCQAVLGNAM